jgi:transposase InsO family protein
MGLTIAWTARLWIDGFSRPRRRTRSDPTSSDSGAKKGCACLTGDDANAPAPSTAPGRPNADAPNKVWAVDFQFDATTDGRPIAGVSIVDEDTRECLGGLVERSVTADRLIDVLDRLATVRGYPAMLGCGSGPELACEAMADWAGERVGISFISPGEPGAMATLSRSTAVCATNASKSTSSGP